MSEKKQLGVAKPLKLASGKSKLSKMSAVMPQGIQKRKKSRTIRKGLKNYIKKSKKPEAIKEEEMMDVGEGPTLQQQSVEKPSDKKDEKGVEGVAEQEKEIKEGVKDGKKSKTIRKGLKNYIKKSEKPEGIKEDEIMDVGEGSISQQQSVEGLSDKKDAKGVEGVVEQEKEIKKGVKDGKKSKTIRKGLKNYIKKSEKPEGIKEDEIMDVGGEGSISQQQSVEGLSDKKDAKGVEGVVEQEKEIKKGIKDGKKSKTIRKGLKNYIKKSEKPEGIKEDEIMDVGEGSTLQQQSVEEPSDKKDAKGVEGVVEQEIKEGVKDGKKSIRKGLKNYIKKSEKPEGIKEEEIMDVGEGSISQQQSVEEPSDKKDAKGVEGVVEQENKEMKQDVKDGKEKKEIQNQETQIKDNEPEATVEEELQKPEKPVEEGDHLEPEATIDEEELPSREEQIVGVYNAVLEEPSNHLYSSFLYTDYGRSADTEFEDFSDNNQVPLEDEATGEIKGVDAEGNKRVDTEKGDEAPKDSSSGGASLYG